jgi:hypothetical protein
MALTLENLAEVLANDTKIKIAAVDIDGLLRGKIMHKDKFLSVVKDGFGKIIIIKRHCVYANKKVTYSLNTCRFLFSYLWLGYSRQKLHYTFGVFR